MFFDTHAHIVSDMYEDIESVLKRAAGAGVTRILNVGIDMDSSREAAEICRTSVDGLELKAAVGVHPNAEGGFTGDHMSGLNELLLDENVIAVGETGLDFYREHVSVDDQKDRFRKHIELSITHEKPLVIHSRSAMTETIDVLREYSVDAWTGIMHCFSGTADDAAILCDMGFMISFAGNVTFPKADDLRQALQAVPLDRLLLETDSPFLAPQSHRGRTNEPAYISETAARAAELKSMETEAIAAQTMDNAKRLFKQ